MIKFEFKSLKELTNKLDTKEKCENFLSKIRWNNKPVCPYCKSDKTCKTADRLKCNSCNTKFSVLVGTIFENSKISLSEWFISIYLASSSSKGISSVQLAKHLGRTQKSAWFILQRIKEITINKSNNQLNGVIEIDETYIGGKAENMHMSKRIEKKGIFKKSIVLGMVQRDGQVKAIKIEDTKANTLKGAIYNNVRENSLIITDEFNSYKGIVNYNHQSVNHSAGEYCKDFSFESRKEGYKAYKIHTNNIEGFWALVKRTIYGTHHWISNKHTQRYLNEIQFRFNFKKTNESDKFNFLISKVAGNRLTYKSLIA